MKFLFITKPFKIEPLGLMYLSSAVQQAGSQADLSLTSDDLEKKVKEYSPEIIAYSIMTGDQDFYDRLNKRLKQNYDFFSIAGGPHPTFFPEMLEKSSFDAICRGEGEEALKQFIKDPESEKITNFWFKKKKGIIKNQVRSLIETLDSIPFPDRQIIQKHLSFKEDSIKHFIASRGCPFNCSYCFNEAYSELYAGKGKRVRFRSVDNVLDEVEQVIAGSPTRFIYFQDDTFILNSEWVKEFSEKYNQRIGFPFHCHARANLVTEKIAEDLQSAGCYSVHLAAESGSEKIRKEVLNRNMSDEQILNSVMQFQKRGIKVMLQNILGLPFSSLNDDFKTLELNIKCKPDYAWASIFQPYPRTELGERCVKEGVYNRDFSDINPSFFEQSVLNISNKNEIANLQKLFAIAVRFPDLYHSGRLQKLINLPYEETKERFTLAYQKFRKKADKILYGFDL